ncbi:hypothetical protein [uncultured Reyranella sp.]|uniref:hypothetical protein n=1 Tax=uncultured Reyranella sp. TaxID=735512 RepID=UPI0025D66133|nr:hypothetical protein [uncultured Reyranella sp.]
MSMKMDDLESRVKSLEATVQCLLEGMNLMHDYRHEQQKNARLNKMFELSAWRLRVADLEREVQLLADLEAVRFELPKEESAA